MCPEYRYQIMYQYDLYDTITVSNETIRKYYKAICVKDIMTQEEICHIEGDRIEPNESRRLIESETKVVSCRNVFEAKKVLKQLGLSNKDAEDLIETLLYQIKSRLIQKESR